jgi:hypothetical protein
MRVAIPLVSVDLAVGLIAGIGIYCEEEIRAI